MSASWVYDDGGRKAAGFAALDAGDCVTRAVAIATGGGVMAQIPGPGYGPLAGSVVRTGNVDHGSTGAPTYSEPLHIVTQDNQGYGSQRRCCEYCGQMCWPGISGSASRWTRDWSAWEFAPDNCRSSTKAEAV